MIEENKEKSEQFSIEQLEREKKLIAKAAALRANKKFLMIPASVSADRRLTLTDVVVLHNLTLLVGNDKWCWPSRSLLAVLCGLNIDTGKRQVSRSLRNLEEYGYIRRKRQYREDGGNKSNLYQIILNEDDQIHDGDSIVITGDNDVTEVVTQSSPHELELKKYINNPLCVSPVENEMHQNEISMKDIDENDSQNVCLENNQAFQKGIAQVIDYKENDQFNIIFIIQSTIIRRKPRV